MQTTDTPKPVSASTRLLTITEVADMLGVSVRHVRRLVHERRIPFIKWGHLIRFDPKDVRTWLHENRREVLLSRGGR